MVCEAGGAGVGDSDQNWECLCGKWGQAHCEEEEMPLRCLWTTLLGVVPSVAMKYVQLLLELCATWGINSQVLAGAEKSNRRLFSPCLWKTRVRMDCWSYSDVLSPGDSLL